MSEYVKINPKYLSRSFLKETGMKFTEFIQKERIREACVLLRTTEMSCIEIANALSFSSQSYFIKIFSDVMGITPQKYRAERSSVKRVVSAAARPPRLVYAKHTPRCKNVVFPLKYLEKLSYCIITKNILGEK